MFSLYTPGGGGYGKEEEEDGNGTLPSKRKRLNETFAERGSVFEYRRAQESVWGEGANEKTWEKEGERREKGMWEDWKGIQSEVFLQNIKFCKLKLFFFCLCIEQWTTISEIGFFLWKFYTF